MKFQFTIMTGIVFFREYKSIHGDATSFMNKNKDWACKERQWVFDSEEAFFAIKYFKSPQCKLGATHAQEVLLIQNKIIPLGERIPVDELKVVAV